MSSRPTVVLALALTACSAGVVADSAAPDAGAPGKGDDLAPRPDAAPSTGCTAADQPDLMIVLDRTVSMLARPDGGQGTLEASKWAAAVAAVEAMATTYEAEIRLGLAMFPADPDGAGGRDCASADAWLSGGGQPDWVDPTCGPGEVKVVPGEASAAAIAEAIDPHATGLCNSTPIGAGLEAARASLAASPRPEGGQAVLLLTDGVDRCDGAPGYTTETLPTADALLAAGVKTFVVGFDGSGLGVDRTQLNDLACAGGTAPSQAQNCVATGTAYRAVAAPSPSDLFLEAGDEAGLAAALADVAEDVACDDLVE